AIAQALLTQEELLGEDVLRIIEEKERERLSQDVITREDTRRLAYHEAGHAVASAMLIRRRDIGRVSIVSSSDTENFNELRPLSEQQTYSREEVLAEIQVRLASRAAEELFLGTVLDNSAGDLKRARDLARYVVTYMNPADSLFVYDPEWDGAAMRRRRGAEPAAQLPTPNGAMPVMAPSEDGAESGESDELSVPFLDRRLRRQADELLRQQYEAAKRLLKENEAEV